MFKISVIIPIYDASFYLRDTLESLLNQTMLDDIEVIIVDDGSMDQSRYIIEEYALDYDNFSAYHKTHEGITFARNYGMDLAKGEYIAFLDADDYIPPNAYENFYNLAQKHNHDIVTGTFLRFNTSHIWNNPIPEFVFGDLDETIESTNLFEYDNLTWDSLVWNKIYKRQFLEQYDIKFPYENIVFEDNLFTIKAYVHAQSVGVLNKKLPVYYWRVRDDNSSVSQEISLKNFNDRIKIMHLVNDVMVENIDDLDIINKKYKKWLIHDLMNVSHVNRFPLEIREELLNSVVDVLKLGPDKILDSIEHSKADIYKKLLKKDFSDYLMGENYFDNSHLGIQIDDNKSIVTFENNYLKFSINPENNNIDKIKENSYHILLKNKITSKEIKYNLVQNEKNFYILIPYLDLLSEPIKKWVLDVDFKLDSFEYKFIHKDNIINLSSKDNLVFIDLEHYSYSKSFNYFNLVSSKNKKLEKDLKFLSKDNKSIKKKNDELIYRINQYKSRKIVRCIDKIKKIL